MTPHDPHPPRRPERDRPSRAQRSVPTRPLTPRPVTVTQTSSPARPLGHAILLAGAALLVTVACVLLMRDRPADLPPALLREWHSAHPDYAGRAIAFSPDEVSIIASSGEPAHRYPISHVARRDAPEAIELSVTYMDAGDPLVLDMTLLPLPQPRLRFARPHGLTWYPAR